MQSITTEEGNIERIIECKDYTPELRLEQYQRTVRGDIVDRNRLVIDLKNDDEIVAITGQPLARLLVYMNNLGYRNLARICKGKGLEMAREAVNDAWGSMGVKALKLEETNGAVSRVTTDVYESVATGGISGVVENRLKAEGIDFDKVLKYGGRKTTYLFKNTLGGDLKDEVRCAIVFHNVNSGLNAMKFFGGAEVTVCSNGCIFGAMQASIRLVHVENMKEVERKVEDVISHIVENINVIPKQLMKMRGMKIDKEEAKQLISMIPVPKYLRQAIWDRLFEKSTKTRNGKMDWDSTLYGVYMAATYVSTHKSTLSGKRDSTYPITMNNATKISDAMVWTDTWDVREKKLQSGENIAIVIR